MELAKGKRLIIKIIGGREIEIGYQNGGCIQKLGSIYPSSITEGAREVFMNMLKETAEAKGMELSVEEWNC